MEVNMKSWFKKNYKVIIAIIFVGLLCCIPFIWSDWFFGTPTTIASKLTYIGAFIGGILLAINAYFIYKRTKELNRSNNLVAKGQLDTRFKDAATLLAAGNTSAELSGIHALHQIAIEASKTEDQKDYVKVIKDILIAFIKENSVIEYKKDENGKILLDEFDELIVEKAYNTKSNIVLQTIIDKLFIDGECKIYTEYSIYLSETVLHGISFAFAQLQNVNFIKVQLQNSYFLKAQLENVYFRKTELENVIFEDARLQSVRFINTQLQNTRFVRAQLQSVRFVQAQLEYANFREAQLEYVYFEDTQLENVLFRKTYNINNAEFYRISWNEKTDFQGTAFENKTIEELTEIMGKPPTPLDK
jgi:uncharacterized protein YjbI with pentapeptide repeats